MRTLFWAAWVLALGALVETAPAAGASEFGDTWYDGRGELNGYQLTVSRYGQERTGTAVLIYVTEPFDPLEHVKADTPGEGTINVLKLNLVRDFVTGIYDYNTMVSLFSDDTTLKPQKVSFSSAEWCGHVYEEQIVEAQKLERRVFSYFQGESGSDSLPYPEGGILEDQLFVLLRSLRGPFLEPGEEITLPFLPGPFVSRLSHVEPQWTSIHIKREQAPQSLSVPAGDFVSHRYTVDIAGGRNGVFWVEDAYPHRLLRWQLAPDIDAVLTASKRLAYWRLHDNGQETYRTELGLK